MHKRLGERHKGTKAQRHKGTKAQRHKGTKAPKILTKLAIFSRANPEESFNHGWGEEFRVQSAEFREGRKEGGIPCLRAVTHRQAVRHFNLRNQELEDHDQDFGTSLQHPETGQKPTMLRLKASHGTAQDRLPR